MKPADLTTAIRLGDLPAIRNAFRALVDYPAEPRITAGSPGLLIVALGKACEALAGDAEPMPQALCDALGLPLGSTYSQGAMAASHRRHGEISQRIINRFPA